MRKDIALDFPSRGSIACECGNSMTSCYSISGTGTLHAYYLCQNRQCEHTGKSIRRDVIEGEFEELLKTLTPSQGLISAATEMFKIHWKNRESSEKQRQALLRDELQKADKDIELLLDRIGEAESSTVVNALEKRIGKLKESKFRLEEKIAQIGRPLKPYNEMYRTAMQFLAKPYRIREKGSIADRKAVLKLVFTERLVYDRINGYRTQKLSLPFKVLGGIMNTNVQMVATPRFELGTPTLLVLSKVILHPTPLQPLSSTTRINKGYQSFIEPNISGIAMNRKAPHTLNSDILLGSGGNTAPRKPCGFTQTESSKPNNGIRCRVRDKDPLKP